MNKHEHVPDPEKNKEILNVVSDRVPELLKNLSDVLYGPNQAKKFGKAAAVFYKELKDTGMSKEQIFALTQQYMSSLSIGNTFGKFASGHNHNHNYNPGHKREHDFGEEIGSHVRKKIRRELQEK